MSKWASWIRQSINCGWYSFNILCGIVDWFINQKDISIIARFFGLWSKTTVLPPEMLFIDRKYPNEHLRYEKSTSHDIFSTFLWYTRLDPHSKRYETSNIAPFFGFWGKTAVLPPEMLFLDLKPPNKHLEYDKSTSYDIQLTFSMIF